MKFEVSSKFFLPAIAYALHKSHRYGFLTLSPGSQANMKQIFAADKSNDCTEI